MRAKIGLIAPDETTFAYVAGREYAPKELADAIADWQTLKPSEDAVFDTQLTLDASQLEPYITWGTNPEMGSAYQWSLS